MESGAFGKGTELPFSTHNPLCGTFSLAATSGEGDEPESRSHKRWWAEQAPTRSPGGDAEGHDESLL